MARVVNFFIVGCKSSCLVVVDVVVEMFALFVSMLIFEQMSSSSKKLL